jgi:hypothetical protein
VGKDDLFDILKNLQVQGSQDGQIIEYLADAAQSLIKEVTSGLNQEQRQELDDFIEQTANQLDCSDLLPNLLKLLAELERE